MKPKYQFILKRGKCITRFEHIENMFACWRVFFGSVMFRELPDGEWEPVL